MRPADVDPGEVTRRSFLKQTIGGTAAALAGASQLAAEDSSPTETSAAPPRKATDLVPLGKSGLRICRLGMGTGSNGGQTQRDLGQDGFTRLIRHGYDRGVRFIDTADMYKIHDMVAKAVKELPRESLWIQTKIRWEPEFIAEGAANAIDRFRRELGTEYFDSLLIHCATTPEWTSELRRLMDFLDEAKEKKVIRLHGVSCHGLPALRAATKDDWIDVHLCRVNPQGHHVDGLTGRWSEPGKADDAFAEIREMHRKGRGVIGMKISGNGDFKTEAERERSVRFAMQCGFVDAVVMGFKSPAEIDEAILRIDRALAEKTKTG